MFRDANKFNQNIGNGIHRLEIWKGCLLAMIINIGSYPNGRGPQYQDIGSWDVRILCMECLEMPVFNQDIGNGMCRM